MPSPVLAPTPTTSRIVTLYRRGVVLLAGGGGLTCAERGTRPWQRWRPQAPHVADLGRKRQNPVSFNVAPEKVDVHCEHGVRDSEPLKQHVTVRAALRPRRVVVAGVLDVYRRQYVACGDVAHHNVVRAARRLRTQRDAQAVQQGHVYNDHVVGRHIEGGPGRPTAGLDGDAVVAVSDATIGNFDEGAGVRVDAVRVG